jgi:uncharacterized phage-associated protein
MTYDVITIADEMLKAAKRDGKTLTPMQLMKLVYIAHGWSLAIRDIDLFENRIEAWKYGPVIPDLYHATKKYGRNSIPLSHIVDTHSNVDAGTTAFITDVYSKYGHLDGIALSRLTHMSGSPWDQAYRGHEIGAEISDEIIKPHYIQLLQRHNS